MPGRRNRRGLRRFGEDARDQIVVTRSHDPGVDQATGSQGVRIAIGQVDHRVDFRGLAAVNSPSLDVEDLIATLPLDAAAMQRGYVS